MVVVTHVAQFLCLIQKAALSRAALQVSPCPVPRAAAWSRAPAATAPHMPSFSVSCVAGAQTPQMLRNGEIIGSGLRRIFKSHFCPVPAAVT